MNTNEQTMAWIMDTYSMHKRHTVTAVVTGKPMELGGSRGRPEATGRGCMIVTLQALKRFGMAPEDTRVVIQGFGNVGGMAAQADGRAGFKIIGIIEYDGAVYNPTRPRYRGADGSIGKETGSIIDFAEAEDMDKDEAMSPGLRRAAPGRQGKRDHLGKCRPHPLQNPLRRRQRPDHAVADAILAEKKIFVIPDILANAGGVTVSYFEWVQDRQGFFWNETARQRAA